MKDQVDYSIFAIPSVTLHVNKVFSQALIAKRIIEGLCSYYAMGIRGFFKSRQ
ncbi:hypothetical protein J2S09_003909 [Bacillus fengqiuensis]|nr:hypothetical protein [Bacillus fengqiuensis]